ncbi:transposable element Tcb2 transposase [Trichonephila clavipes]|nr:transposable element Tcb2 transposase [Trichonephila clavipes]
MDPTCQQRTVQGGGGSVMVRKQPVRATLLPMMSIVHSDGLGEFQQGNATPHTSRIATEWLQEHSSEFRHFCWPPKSPDINIIEHISDALQRAVQKRSPHPLSPTNLWTALQESWCVNYL